MYLSHISTLEEAAAYLSGKTGESWTPKSVLDFALTKSKQSSRKPAPIAFAAMPIGTTFGRYEFTSPGGMVRKGSARWQLVPLYPIHAAQLVAAGNTFAGLVESPDDDHADGEHYAFIEPLESEHEITLDMVRLKRAAIESIAKQCPAASSGAPESAEPPWKTEAVILGNKYIKAWRDEGYEPTGADAALYIEGEFSTLGIYGKHKEVLDAAYIARHALTGITGNKPGHKSKKPKVPDGKRSKLP